MKTKKGILTLLLIIWLSVIFIFSNQKGKNSESLSDKVTLTIIETTSNITSKEYSNLEKENIIIEYRYLIRKTAHIIIYFILGILIYLTLDIYNVKHKFIYSIVFCLLYAVSDEIHQMFSSNRSAKIIDVLIDFCGSMISIVIINKIESMKICKKIK